MRSFTGSVSAAVLIVAALSLVSCAPELYSSGGTSTYFGFTLGVESAPPPPHLEWRDQPRYDAVEASEVRVVESPDPGCDLFSYGGSFWLYSGGFWYRSARYDGPFVAVEVRRVPRPVLTVPESHWHHRPHWDPNEQNDRGNHGRHGGHDNQGDHGDGDHH